MPGEIYVGGPGVGQGYIFNEKLSQERFINHPYFEAGKLYKSGDLAKYDGDGNLIYIGRRDQQVKVRGFRIELGEIETHLTKIPFIRQVVVCVKSHEGIDFIVAYLKIANNHTLDSTYLKGYLKQYLPEYMIPHKIVEIQDIPLTGNGKCDYRKLPCPFSIVSEVKEIKSASLPQSSNTEIFDDITQFIQSILGNTDVNLNQTFFNMGGDSLLALKMLTRLKKYNANVTLENLYTKSINEIIGTFDKIQVSETDNPDRINQESVLTGSIPGQNLSPICLDTHSHQPVSAAKSLKMRTIIATKDFSLYNSLVSLHIEMPLYKEILKATLQRYLESNRSVCHLLHQDISGKFFELHFPEAVIPVVENEGISNENFCISRFLEWTNRELNNGFDLFSTLPIRFFIIPLEQKKFVLTLSFTEVSIDESYANKILCDVVKKYAETLFYTELDEKYGPNLTMKPEAKLPDLLTSGFQSEISLKHHDIMSKFSKDQNGDFSMAISYAIMEFLAKEYLLKEGRFFLYKEGTYSALLTNLGDDKILTEELTDIEQLKSLHLVEFIANINDSLNQPPNILIKFSKESRNVESVQMNIAGAKFQTLQKGEKDSWLYAFEIIWDENSPDISVICKGACAKSLEDFIGSKATFRSAA